MGIDSSGIVGMAHALAAFGSVRIDPLGGGHWKREKRKAERGVTGWRRGLGFLDQNGTVPSMDARTAAPGRFSGSFHGESRHASVLERIARG